MESDQVIIRVLSKTEKLVCSFCQNILHTATTVFIVDVLTIYSYWEASLHERPILKQDKVALRYINIYEH